MDKISIIIPCYNAENTIARTLDSILNQDYKNLEIITINDGSKDNTLKILNEYAEKDSRILVFNKPNGGVSSARNLGLSKATGSLIEFVDSDDYFLRNDAISYNYNLMKQHDVDVVIFNFTHPCFALSSREGVLNLEDPKDFMTLYKDFFALILPWNKIIKRELLTKPYIEGVAFAEDELYNIDNILPSAKKVYISTRVDFNYTCNSSTSAINSTLAGENLLNSFNTIWYKSNKNKELRDEILFRNFPLKAKKLSTIRSFDFLMFDIEFMCYYDLPEEILAGEVLRVSREKDFITASKKLFNITENDINERNSLNFAIEAKKLYKDLFASNKLAKITKELIRLYRQHFGKNN